MTDHLLRGVAVPNFGDEPTGLIELGVAAEEAGFDGFFVWDHIVFSNTGDGPPIIDPWLVLAVVAARTSRIKLGTMITPVPRRRPWQLARQITSLDRLSGGRVILGVGIGSPAYGDFGIFHEPTGDRVRADMLDEGLAVLDGLWSGERFSYAGEHYTVDPVRFTPVPVQRPRVPIWVGGVLPNARPIARAARWDGVVPIRFAERSLVRPSAQDIADVRAQVAAARGTADGFDIAVWAEVAPEPAAVPGLAAPYQAAGATWWIETAKPEPALVGRGHRAGGQPGLWGERNAAAGHATLPPRASCRSHCSLALATRGGTPSRRNCSPAAAISSMRRTACRTLPCSSRSSVLAEAPSSSRRMLSRSHCSHPAALAARSASVTAAASPL